MEPKTIERMKRLVREDFEGDAYNQLIGFLTVENTIEDAYPQDYYAEGTVLVFYRPHTGGLAFEKLDDMVANILDKKMREVEELAERGPVKIVATGGIYIVIPPNYLPPDEDGWKLLSPEGEESYYFSLKELWEEIQDEGIIEIY